MAFGLDAIYSAGNNDTANQIQKIMGRLASGHRINSASEDAAGLSIVSGMTSETNALTVSLRNVSDGISITQTGQGALGSVTDSLQRIREIALSASSGIHTDADIANMQQEVDVHVENIQNIADTTHFNGQKLFDGNFSINIQTGSSPEDSGITIETGNMSPESLGIDSTDSLATIKSGGQNALVSGSNETFINIVDSALSQVSSEQANLGAVENRLLSSIENIDSTRLATLAAQSSRIDTDYAEETSNLSKNLILENAYISVIAQANSSAKNVLGLFNL